MFYEYQYHRTLNQVVYVADDHRLDEMRDLTEKKIREQKYVLKNLK